METISIGPGGKGSEQIMALYIMALVSVGRLDPLTTPTRELIQVEISKDLDTIFKGYEDYADQVAAEEATIISDEALGG